jgi:putative Ca2+/H+ antiporter (TMEM165/GDT1 family)
MKDDIFTKNPVLRAIATVLVSALFIFFGLWFLLNPKQIQKKHAQNFKLNSKFDWGDPFTYLRKPIPLLIIQIIGLLMFFIGMFGLYAI